MIKPKEKKTALFIGILWVQNCEKHFRRPEAKILGLRIGFKYLIEGSNKTRFQYCKNSRNVLLYIRVVQGRTGGNLIAPDLMGNVASPYKWKEFLFHRGCSSLEDEKAEEEDRPSSLHLFGDNPDEEEPSDNLSKPGEVHYHSKWKPRT